jgi:hypothetical protein
VAIVVVALILISAPAGLSAPATRAVSSDDKPPLKKEELEQLLAPIALYPDSLLTQMLMASTYPLEIVQADRWVRAHKDLKGDALARELEKQAWDPAVKSLVNFPEQLSAMNDKLDLTLKIGNAFLEQQADVLNTIQVLRNRAQAQGNLKSNDKQKVQVQAAAPTTTPTANNSTVVNVNAGDASQLTATVVQAPPQIVTIESSSPDVIYVPSYNPTYVYGAWAYPAYPPYYYYPPAYYSNLVSFGFGVACGAAWGYAWGHCNWGSCDVDIDVNRNFERNTNINREQARQNIQNRQSNRQGNREGNRQSWQHDPSHRKGAAYRDQRTSERFGGANSSSQAARAREQYRGRAEAGRQELARGGGGDQFRSASADRGGAGNLGGQNRSTAAGNLQNRGGSAGFNSTASAGNRGYSGTRGGTFDGVSRGSSGARMESQRGYSSGGYRSSPSRGGGGGRGGGGRGGGGRR